jgi:hypothetical protein
MKMTFASVGTDKISIGISNKMGSTSLRVIIDPHQFGPVYNTDVHKTLNSIKKNDTYDENTKYVILIRDVMDKYKSGYKQDLLQQMIDIIPGKTYPEDNHQAPLPINYSFRRIFTTKKIDSFVTDDKNIRWGMNQIVNSHDIADIYESVSQTNSTWFEKWHMNFKRWNHSQENDMSLIEFNKLKNVYFLELKDLSNPKFLIWLQEKDEKWKVVKEIPHNNKTPEYFWKNMDLFWKEYREGKIAKGVLLGSPFYPTENPEIKDILKDIELEQEVVDNIRKYNKRYIKL